MRTEGRKRDKDEREGLVVSETEKAKRQSGENHSVSGTFLAIDLKSFYASVECMDRGRDPLTSLLVVADESRTEKTICLAVSPALKAYGIPGRARLFEVIERVRQVNAERLRRAPGHVFTGKSDEGPELAANPGLELSFTAAPPRMAHYMEISSRIYGIYLKYIAPEDIHVYSIDEVMIDATKYLKTYGMTAHELARRMIREVLSATGITATAGIGSNLYLAKIAMDIEAKHAPADRDGVRIAELDERSYREKLWGHRPLTDFWRVGKGYVKRLENIGLHTMGDIARLSLENEDVLYRIFGVNAELLIDHAWGYEPCTMADIKAFQPKSSSFSSGQVLTCPYDKEHARVVVREMAESCALDLLDKKMTTDQIVLTVGYDRESLKNPALSRKYQGEMKEDRYGRLLPKPAHGSAGLGKQTSSARRITEAALSLYDRITAEDLLIRRIYLDVIHVEEEKKEEELPAAETYEQLDLFTDYEAERRREEEEKAAEEKERQMQEAMLAIRKKFGKNAIVKGVNLREGATGMDRNAQIGGHKA